MKRLWFKLLHWLCYGNRHRCFECNKITSVERWINYTAKFGKGECAISVTAIVPVWSCMECGFVVFDDRSDTILRHELRRKTDGPDN